MDTFVIVIEIIKIKLLVVHYFSNLAYDVTCENFRDFQNVSNAQYGTHTALNFMPIALKKRQIEEYHEFTAKLPQNEILKHIDGKGVIIQSFAS